MTCSRCGSEWCAVDEFGEQAQRAFDGCATTQLEQMRRERDEARAELANLRAVVRMRADMRRIIDEKEGGQ